MPRRNRNAGFRPSGGGQQLLTRLGQQLHAAWQARKAAKR